MPATDIQITPEAKLAQLIRAGLEIPNTVFDRHAYGAAWVGDKIYANTNGFAYMAAVGVEPALAFFEKMLERIGEEDDEEDGGDSEVDPTLHVPYSLTEEIVVLEFRAYLTPAEIAQLLENGNLRILKQCLIRITSVPAGGAPEHIKEKWIGCEFQAEETNAPLADVVTYERVDRKGGFAVEWDVAMAELNKNHPDAVQWWRENTRGLTLIFAPECCEVLSD